MISELNEKRDIVILISINHWVCVCAVCAWSTFGGMQRNLMTDSLPLGDTQAVRLTFHCAPFLYLIFVLILYIHVFTL